MITQTQKTLALLRAYESPNVLYTDPDGTWPIVWERARGVHVWDAEGRKYLDLTGAFGVAAAGHANPKVVAAGQRQMARLLHAMGDVHPHALKAQLARELSRLTFERWTSGKAKSASLTGKTIFCNSGFEAVEAALKTALLATGKSGIIAFANAYHGLGYGALNATYRDLFRSPFKSQLARFGTFVSFPDSAEELARTTAKIERILQKNKVGAILLEPIQARGGINVPPDGFLPALRSLCDQYGVLLVLDEIYTGFGRTGSWFACEHSGTIPDVICLGKALTGGFPLSACVGRANVIDKAWPPSEGEAIHTSTFLGHPVGCAMALAQIAEIQRLHLPEQSADLGAFLMKKLELLVGDLGLEATVRGRGLMVGLDLRMGGKPAGLTALNAIKSLLRRGFILLPEGEHANVISFTPPLVITKPQLSKTVSALAQVLSNTPA